MVLLHANLTEVRSAGALEHLYKKVIAIFNEIREVNPYVNMVGMCCNVYVGLESSTTNAKVDVSFGLYHDGQVYFPYFDGTHICAGDHILPLAACNYFGWPVPCPRLPALHLSLDPSRKNNAQTFNQTFRDEARLAFRNALGNDKAIVHESYKNETTGEIKTVGELEAMMLTCQIGSEMGSGSSLLLPNGRTTTPGAVVYTKDVISTTRCLRDNGWPNLLTACVAGNQEKTEFQDAIQTAQRGAACRCEETGRFTAWSTLY